MTLTLDANIWIAAYDRKDRYHLLTLQPLDEALLARAIRVGSQYRLRSADALYAATADLTSSQLISWDTELVRRANGITPSDWLIVNP